MNGDRLHIHVIETGECVIDCVEPIGETVVHCNSVTEYEWIEHQYAPEKCPMCAGIELSFLRYGGCKK